MPTRCRQWNLTINESSECFEDIVNILNELKNVNYALILHNLDVMEDETPKHLHYHLILDFVNARAFDAIQNKFPGSHIEPVKHFNNSMQYLIHKNNPEKHLYNIDDILSNNAEWLSRAIYSTDILAKSFDFNNVLMYVDDFLALKDKDSLQADFIPYLLSRFNRDTLKIIKLSKQILEFANMKDAIELCNSSIIKDELF